MLLHFIIFFLLIFSILGFGNFLNKAIYNSSISNTNSLGYLGFLGILIFSIISYFLNFISINNYNLINLIILLSGLILFLVNIKNINFKLWQILIIIILLTFFSILMGKPHDDFHYYHFPYIHYILESDLILGIGHLNHGFRTPSSIFYLNALFNYSFTNFSTFHFGVALYFFFFNVLIIDKIYFYINHNYNKLLIFSLLIFAFVNIFFYRLSEHGSDISAQILSLILFLDLIHLNFIDKNNNKILKKSIFNLFIITSLIIGLKAFYLLYLIFGLILISTLYKQFKFSLIKTLKLIFTNIGFIFFCINIIFIFLVYIANTGCILYPVSFTCISSMNWSIPIDEVVEMNNWYELWSKGGASPTFRVLNPDQYIVGLNWLSNWMQVYFFNKVSDFLLGIMILMLLMKYFFNLKFELKKKNFNLLIFLIFLLLLEWFWNHPALRYGGYSLVASLIFIIFSSNFNFDENNFNKLSFKVSIFLSIVAIIFFSRNVHRLYKEIKKYDFNPLIEFSYKISDEDFRVLSRIKSIEEGKDKEFEKIEYLNFEYIKRK